MILIALPRFNRNDFLVDAWTSAGNVSAIDLSDAGEYIKITYWMRGVQNPDSLHAPFTYRPLVPFVASVLPFDAMTSINLINLAALLMALLVLQIILQTLTLPPALYTIGCWLFAFSFPSFYYATVGYVDATLILVLMLGCWFILKSSWHMLALTLSVGICTKETAIVLLPVAVIHLFMQRVPVVKAGTIMLMLVACSAAVFFGIRALSPAPDTHAFTPSIETLLFNLGRFRSWFSVGASLGLPALITFWVLIRSRGSFLTHEPQHLAMLWGGVTMGLLLTVYSLFAAHTDGRFIWTSYPYLIPLAMCALHFRNERCRETAPEY